MDPHVLTATQAIEIACAGIGIAAACGLRAFLPLLALSIAARLGVVHLAPDAAWLSGNVALGALALAAVAELLADKLPLVDHALDALGTFVRPAAAAVAAWATFGRIDPVLSLAAALVLGAGAMGIHALKAKARLGSTALTLGHANPLLSTAEDVTAATLSFTALWLPLLAGALVALLVVALTLARRRARRQAQPGRRPGG
ncbi:MAG TPA: DUF4126 domain-containing protein [Candidatus Acidoferrales bacterium]|nr:DUF4126 domain-containing protein [Candidatus Acidoferrales bacterium]